MTVLKDLLVLSKDGEWGKADQFSGSELMTVARGTDFEAVRNGSLEGVPQRWIAQKAADRKRIEAWDIIIETAGGSKDRPTGRTLLIKPSLVASAETSLICASFARFLRIDARLAHPPFIFWLLQHLYTNGTLYKYHTQHTGVARFQYTTFAENEPLELPPLPTQKRIAAILSAYDDLIENNTRRIAILEEMARRLFEEWFVHFRFPGHEEVALDGDLPSGWRAVTLADVANVNPEAIKPKSAPERIGYIDIASVSPGKIDAVQELAFTEAPGRARRIVRDGDVIWSCVRPNRRSFALVLGPAEDTVASTGFAVLRAVAVPFVYLYCATTTDAFVDYLTNNATGAAYPAVKQGDFERAALVVPSASLLAAFDQSVRPMLRMAESLHRKNANLRAQRDLLLPKLVSGKIDVSGAEAELEAAE